MRSPVPVSSQGLGLGDRPCQESADGSGSGRLPRKLRVNWLEHGRTGYTYKTGYVMTNRLLGLVILLTGYTNI